MTDRFMADHSESSNEALLSKLMDGEISELELHRLLKAIDNDDELRAQWSAWHYSNDVRHGVDVDPLGLELADNVASELGRRVSEEAQSVPANDSRWAAFKQFAVAACAAVFVITVIPFTQTPSNAEPDVMAFQSVDQPVYNLNQQWELPQLSPQAVSAEVSPFSNSLVSAANPNETLSEEALAEQQRVRRLMSEYLWLHAGKAGMNNSSSVRAYLQVSPR